MARSSAMDLLLPALQLDKKILPEDGSVDPAVFFDTPIKHSLVLEIGFGNGEHLFAMMQDNPSAHYLGAEPFTNGMAAFLKMLTQKTGCHPRESGDQATSENDSCFRRNDTGLDNIRVLMDDAMMIVRSAKPETIDDIYILNPDPWPKKRHFKRRMARPENLVEFHRVLKPGGRLICATDVDELAGWMATQIMCHGGFEWTAERADDWRKMPENWSRTRYEIKGEAAGRKQSYLIFKKA